MQIYVFDRSCPTLWRAVTREDVRFCKFVGWLHEKESGDGILAVDEVIIDHDAIRDSFLEFYNTDNPKGLGNPNAAGIVQKYKITDWHSMRLNLSTSGDLMLPITEAIANISK